jgi:hypothetical protein
MKKAIKNEKMMSFFMVWLMLSKVEKGNRKKQPMECHVIVSTNIM